MNLSASSAKPADPTYFLEGVIHDKSEMADFEGPLSDEELAACEAKYYGNNEWYPRYGELYYQFMQARYSL